MNLFRGRRFLPLFWTQFFGAFNDNFLKNALVILVTYRSSSVFGLPPSEVVVLAGGIFILPFFLFSALAGQIADKFEKAQVIHWIKTAEICIMLIASYGLIEGKFELLLLALFLMGLHSTFFGPIKYSILPQHLPELELVSGNAMIEAGTFIAILLGTIAGGVLVGVEHGTVILSCGLVSCAVIGFTVSLFIPKALPVEPKLELQFNPVPPTIEMFTFARKTKSVFLSILGISWFWLFGAALLSLFAPLCKEVLKADERVVTLFLAVFSVGVAVGSVGCERLSRKRLELGLVPFGSIGISIFAILMSWLSSSAAGRAGHSVSEVLSTGFGRAIVVDLFFLAVFSGFFIVPLYTMMQERSEAKQRSRVIAANNVLNALFMVISSIAITLLLHFRLTIPEIILVLAILNVAVALYIYSLLPEFLLRFLIWTLAIGIYRLRVRGDDNIPREGPAILICNHVSFVDWMIIAAAIRRPIRFVMDHRYFKGFIRRHLFNKAGVIPIAPARENQAILDRAFERMAEELRRGELICIFPEGHITDNGELGVFKPGVLKLLGKTPVPVIPMALNGLWGSLFSRKDKSLIKKRPRRFWQIIELVITAPIPPEQATIELMRQKVESLSKGL